MEIPPPSRRAPTLTRRHLLLGTAAAGAIALTGCRGAAIDVVTPEPVGAFPGLGDPPLLVDVAWLRERSTAEDADRLVVLDLSDLATYREGHIPGAIHAWWQDWIDPYSDIYGVLLGTRNDPNARQALLGRLGIDDQTTVVAYDASRNRYAARMVWILKYLGLHRASVLDGGVGAWRGAGESTSSDDASPRGAGPVTLAPATDWTVPWDEMVDRYADPTLTILDVRTDDEADDDLNGLLHRGMIPNAIRLPWAASLRDRAGRLLPPDALATLYRDAGVFPEDEVAVVARFGVEACQTWLVLTLLGYERVRIFDRGWAHWGRKDIDVPIAELTPLS